MTKDQSPLFNIFHYQIGNDGARILDDSVDRGIDCWFCDCPVHSWRYGTHKKFWLTAMLKLLKSLFRHWGILSLNLRIVRRGSNGPTLFIPSIQRLRTRMYRTNQTSVWYAFKGAPMQKAVFLGKNKNSALSEHVCQTNHTTAWNNCEIIYHEAAVPSTRWFESLAH